MSEEAIIVSSAVVLPEALDGTVSSPTQGTKRRASSASSASSKRPKVLSRDDLATGSKAAPSRHVPADAVERKRGKRLFGGLLGTLSQNSVTSTQKRRIEIERKQREKLRAQATEDIELKKQNLEKLNAARRAEQIIWDREALRTRHENERSVAGFMRTETQPSLYYRPWELRSEEEELIKHQLREVEQKIVTELDNNSTAKQESTSQDIDMKEHSETHANKASNSSIPIDDNQEDNSRAMSHDNNDHRDSSELDSENALDKQDKPDEHGQTTAEGPKDHMEETGEDVVQGDEDAVLY